VKAFDRDGDDAVAFLDTEERLVIARIVADVGMLLGNEDFGELHPVEDTDEDALFRHLAGLEKSLATPDDPAVLRLLPPASKDTEIAQEFRNLTEHGLREDKTQRLREVWTALSQEQEEWRVPLEHATATAAALTDVRLVLATRLGLETDEDAERLHTEIALAGHAVDTDAAEDLGVDPQRAWLGMVYQALTWLQDSLVTAAMGEPVVYEEGSAG